MYCRTLIKSFCRQSGVYHRSVAHNIQVTKIYIAGVVDEAEDTYSSGTSGLILCFYESLHAATRSKIPDRFAQVVIDIVGSENVSTTDAVREQHGHDESYHATALPDIVAFAESTEHVSRLAKLCNDHEVPLIPFISGTGMEGGINALKGGLCLDLSKMKNIVSVHPEDFDCTVEAGVTRVTLNNYLRDTGLTFPIDPGADASICGMCATSASGTNAVRYGTMRENVLNMEVVLPDGRVIYTTGKGRRTKKTSAGYNLTNLFVGSEGTLGIITQATLRLHGIPEATIAAVCSFNTIQEAVDSTVQILQMGIPIARIELLDELMVDACNRYSKLDMKVAPSLFVEFTGSPDTLDKQAEVVKDIATMNGGSEFKWASKPEERNQLWKARHDILYACMALKPGSKPYSTDVCVPISNLPEVVVRSKEAIQKAGIIDASMVGHVGDGNIHTLFLFDTENKEEVQLVKNLADTIATIAMELDGTCTGEHGIGMGKRGLLQQEIGDAGIEVMKQLKRTLDPKGIMNPGKVLPE